MTKEPPEDRRETLALRLKVGQSLSATALAAEFHVSPDAIRRDLRALAAEGRCRRVYGGALPISPASTPMSVRTEEGAARKAALATAAVKEIRAGQMLFLDNGSTNLALAEQLPSCGLTVVTNSIAIAATLASRNDLQLHLVGGAVRSEIGGCVDASASLAVQQFHIDLCFLGACAVSAGAGIAAFDAEDASFKRALLRCCERVALMTTSEKFATRAPFRVASIEAVDALIMERDTVEHPDLDVLRALDINVVFAG